MARTTSVMIGEQHDAFVKAQIAAGRYATTSEAVRAGLQLLADREQRRLAVLQSLRNAPTDSAPITSEERADLSEGRSQRSEGETFTSAEVFRPRPSS